VASLIVLVAFLLGKILAGSDEPSEIIYAQGGIEVDFETGNWPFMETNFLPGDSATKWVRVKNNSGARQRVGMRIKAQPGGNRLLSFFLLLRLQDADTGANLYGGSQGKLLLASYFYPTEQFLFELGPGQARNLNVRIKFMEQAGNFLQEKITKFDFSLGFIGRRLRR
ncbi:hypothetical protein HY946_00380, partial [Candidatus Gottesmanbacteria bacterium]|nr:hypothetical protein [Candidatus Gottesmanbacteria bacterium]